MFLSIIIPCYRETREVLYRALDSLHFLTDLCPWEAWIVDDGSEEGCVAAWVDERHDPHLHCLRQSNKGQASARNLALEQARGEYIVFLDADDELLPEPYTQIINILATQKPDLVGYRYQATDCLSWEGDATTFMATNDVVPSVCTYAIKRDVLGNLRFTPGIYHEDEEFVTLLHLRAHSLVMTPLVAYRYHATAGSTMLSHNAAHIGKRFADLLGIIKRTSKLLSEMEADNDGSVLPANQNNVGSVLPANQNNDGSALSANQNAHIAAKALNRRLHVMAMCFVVNLIKDAPSTAFIKTQLRSLYELGFYPLPALGQAQPPFTPIRRYRWIRLFTKKPWLVAMAHKLYK